MVRLWTGLLAVLGVASAQDFSGPNEAKVPRSAEAFALGRAVCGAKVWLGPLSGCTLFTYPGSSVPELRGPKFRFIPSAVLYGSFSAPNTQEALAQFCTETESCLSDAVLLRRVGAGWKALIYLQGFDLGNCLTYPLGRVRNQSAAVCLASDDLGTKALRAVSWKSGRPQVQTLARFDLIRSGLPNSAACLNGLELSPLLWDDRDRDLNGRPDLTLAVYASRYDPNRCAQTWEVSPPISSQRVDLGFRWDGERFSPLPATKTLVDQYGAQP